MPNHLLSAIMKSFSFRLPITFLALFALFFACKKNPAVVPILPAKVTYATIEKMHEYLSPKANSYTFDAATPYTIVNTVTGTLINIQPNSFMLNGTLATGNITVTVKELSNRGEMILSGIFTQTDDGKVLESAGMIEVRAYKGSIELSLKSGSTIAVNMTNNGDQSKNDYQLFTLKNNNWSLKPGAKAFALADSGSSKYVKYFLGLDSLGWTNCDRYYDINPKTDLHVKLDGGFDLMNTMVSVVLKSNRVACSLIRDLNKNEFSFSAGNYLGYPLGVEADIVVISVKDNYMYMIKKSLTIGNNETLTLKPEAISEADMVNILKLLN